MVHGNDKAISTTACMCAVQNLKKKVNKNQKEVQS